MAVETLEGILQRDPVKTRRGWCEVCGQIAARPRPCPQTLPIEQSLGEFALINGVWATFLPGGYVNGGWSVARLVVPQQAYGVACIVLSILAAAAYAHGAIKYRQAVCVLGLSILLVVAPLIFIGNPLSPLLPVYGWIARRRFWIIGQFIDHRAEERRRERRERILRGDAP